MVINGNSPKQLTGFRRIFSEGEKWLNIVGIGLIFFIVLSITVDVTWRKISGSSITGVYELNELLMVGCFLVLSYTQRERGHVQVDVVLTHLSSNARHYVEIVALSLTFVVCAIFFWQSILQSSLAFQMKLFTEGIVQYQLWPIRVGVSIGFLFLCIRLVIQWVEMVSKKK